MTFTIGAVTLLSWRVLESESILRQRAICISSRAVAIAACVFLEGHSGVRALPNLLEETRERDGFVVVAYAGGETQADCMRP